MYPGKSFTQLSHSMMLPSLLKRLASRAVSLRFEYINHLSFYFVFSV